MDLRILFVLFVVATVAVSQTNNAFRCSIVDLGILVDSSGSITNPQGTSPWEIMKVFITYVISRLNLGPNKDYVGLVQFSDEAVVVANLTTYTNDSAYYKTILELFELNGNTNTGKGLEALRLVTFAPGNGERPAIPNVAIVITDGRSNVDIASTVTNANLLKNSGVTVFVIGVTKDISEDELKVIATSPNHIVKIDDYSMMLDLKFINDFMALICRTTNAPADCQKKLDLAFILDESSSITFSSNLPWTRDLLSFTSDVIKYFNVSSIDTRVGIVKFATSSSVAVRFDAYPDLSLLLPVVYNLTNTGGITNLASGFRVAREQLFTTAGGHRNNVVNIAILITDGAANVETENTFSEAESLKNTGVEIFGIGITDQVNVTELQYVVSRPNNTHFFQLTTYDQLSQLIGNITTSVCASTGVTPLPTASTRSNFFSTVTVPGTCTVPNCAFCSNSGQCLSCNLGYFLNTQTSPPTCQQCLDNCQRCINAFTCDNCIPPFVWNSNACQIVCLASVQFCVRCNPADTCLQCVAGYYLDNTVRPPVCRRCGANCATCTGPGFCQCQPGYTWNPNTNPPSCAVSCNQNVANCLICNPADRCIQCASGYFLDSTTNPPSCRSPCNSNVQNCLLCSSPGVCMKCQTGFYLDNTVNPPVCRACLANCADCIAANQCSQCASGLIWNPNPPSCIGQCTVPNCLQCSQGNICGVCKDGFFLDTSTNPPMCRACSANCLSCSNSNSCNSCARGFYLNTNMNPPVCTQCPLLCNACRNGESCDECFSGTAWNQFTRPPACTVQCLSNIVNCQVCYPAVMATLL